MDLFGANAMDLFGAKDDAAEQARRLAVTRLKAMVRQLLQLGEDDTVMVTELACNEPGCPPRETVIAVLAEGKPTRQWKFHQAAADVDAVHLLAAMLW